jgi:hypothetical protein
MNSSDGNTKATMAGGFLNDTDVENERNDSVSANSNYNSNEGGAINGPAVDSLMDKSSEQSINDDGSEEDAEGVLRRRTYLGANLRYTATPKRVRGRYAGS